MYYKLTIVFGPNRGSSFVLGNGENSIGRNSANAVVLSSSKVSKEHCVLVVNNGEIVLKDKNSSNGTFVNGNLTRTKKIKPGDKIGVGDFILEVSNPAASAPRGALPVSGVGNIVQYPGQFSGQYPGQFPSQVSGQVPMQNQGQLPADSLGNSNAAPMPTDLKDKALWLFENRLMQFFYNINLKHEWSAIVVGLVAAFIIGTIFITVNPLLETNHASIVKESGRRARFMAMEIAGRNAAYLAARTETRTDIGEIGHADGVRVAVLVDLDNRIIAPPSKLNQYLSMGREAVLAVEAAKKFRAGKEVGWSMELDPATVAAVEPVKIFQPSLAKNVVAAMAIVSIDTSLATLDGGEIGMVYSEAFIMTVVLGGFVFLVLYRLTLKPLRVLEEDLNKVLNGNATHVTHEYKLKELNPLWDLIGSAAQRLTEQIAPRSGETSASSVQLVDEYLPPIKIFGTIGECGVVLCDGDRKIAYVNQNFEELAGIHADGVIGQEIPMVARDQSLGLFVSELFNRAACGQEPVNDSTEFSGVFYQVYVAAFGAAGEQPKGYLLVTMKADTED